MCIGERELPMDLRSRTILLHGQKITQYSRDDGQLWVTNPAEFTELDERIEMGARGDAGLWKDQRARANKNSHTHAARLRRLATLSGVR